MAMHFSVLKSNKDNTLSDLGPRSVLIFETNILRTRKNPLKMCVLRKQDS